MLILQDPPKFTQIGIFGLKICHLATLVLIKDHLFLKGDEKKESNAFGPFGFRRTTVGSI
jgi:hypothetical protein